MQTLIIGNGHLGWAVASAAGERGERTPILGRPIAARHDRTAFGGADLVVDCSAGGSVRTNVEAALDGGIRRFVIATTGWETDRASVERALLESGACAVVAPNFSLGVALFGRLVETAASLFGSAAGFDPYLVEWHRRGKADRPSGTALDIARRIHGRGTPDGSGDGAAADELEIVSIRAGSAPGMHLVGFDAPGETLELRLTARDRSAYAGGILAATDWLRRSPRSPGIHPFDPVVDALLGVTAGLAA